MAHRTLVLAVTCLVALGALAATAAAAPGPPARGKYYCYNGYSSAPTMWFKILRHHRYKTQDGKKGRYRYKAPKVRFKSGPFKGEWKGVAKGRHYANRSGYTIFLRAAGDDFKLDCYTQS